MTMTVGWLPNLAVNLAMFVYRLAEVCHLEHKPQFSLTCILPHLLHA